MAHWEWRKRSDGTRYRSFAFYDTKTGKRVRLRVSEVPLDIQTDEDAEAFCQRLAARNEAARLRIQRRLQAATRFYNYDGLLDTFKRERPKESPNNWENDVYYLTHYVFPFFLRENDLCNPNDWPVHFEAYRSWLETCPKLNGHGTTSWSTKNQCIKALNAFLRVLHRTGEVLEPPRPCPRFPVHLENRKGAEVLISEEDARRLEEWLRGRA